MVLKDMEREISAIQKRKYTTLIAVTMTLSRISRRVIEDETALSELYRELELKGIIGTKAITIQDYLVELVWPPADRKDEINAVLEIIHENYLAAIFLKFTKYMNGLSDLEKKMKQEEKIVSEFLALEGIKADISFNSQEIYHFFLAEMKRQKELVNVDELLAGYTTEPSTVNPSAYDDKEESLESQAVKAEEEGNYDEAFALYLQAARQNSQMGQFRLACCYYFGEGTGEDAERAKEWFQRAYENEGDFKSGAACFLGYIAYDAEDYSRAFRYFTESANDGSASAQFELGECYFCGLGTDVDTRQAIRWWIKAAENNDIEAQVRLGQLYYDGDDDVPKDERQAKKWLLKAVKWGSEDACAAYCTCFLDKDVWVTMDGEQEIYKKCREFVNRHAKNKNRYLYADRGRDKDFYESLGCAQDTIYLSRSEFRTATGKSGFAITSNGITVKMGYTIKHTSYGSLAQAKNLVDDRIVISANQSPIAYITDISRKEREYLLQLFADIADIVRKDFIEREIEEWERELT